MRIRVILLFALPGLLVACALVTTLDATNSETESSSPSLQTLPPSTAIVQPLLTATALPLPPATMTIDGKTQLAEIGSFCWRDKSPLIYSLVCSDPIYIPTVMDSLQIATPFTATFHLPPDYPPQSLVLAMMDISLKDEVTGVNSPDIRYWQAEPGWAGGLPLKTDVSYQFQEGDGLYIVQLRASWKDIGRVDYNFLVQVGKGSTVPSTPPMISYQPPVTTTIPLVSPALVLGKGAVTQMALSPDGKLWSLVSPFGLSLYSTSDQALLWTRSFPIMPTTMAFSPDSRFLAVGSEANVLSILDASTGETLNTIIGEGHIHGVWSPDGTRLLTSGDCEEIKIWDAASISLIHTLIQAQCNPVTPGYVDAFWSGDSHRIFAGAAYRNFQVWDATSYQPLPDYQPQIPNPAFPSELVPSPAQNIFAYWDGASIELLDGITGGAVMKLSGARIDQIATPLIWSFDGQRLAAGTSSGLAVWDVAPGKEAILLSGYSVLPGTSFTSDGETLVGLSSPDGNLNAVNLATEKVEFSLGGLTPVSAAPIFLKWGSSLLQTYDGVNLWTWNFLDGKQVSREAAALPSGWPMAYSQDHNVSADGTRKVGSITETKDLGNGMLQEVHRLAVVDATTNQLQVMMQEADENGRDISAWSPDGSRIVSGSGLGLASTVVWETQTGKLLLTLPNSFDGKTTYTTDLTWSPDGGLIAGANLIIGPSGEDLGSIVLWDASTGSQVRVLTSGLNGARITAPLAWSPDGQWLAAGVGSDVLVWGRDQEQPTAVLECHPGSISGISWSENSAMLAANSADGTIMIWDLDSIVREAGVIK